MCPEPERAKHAEMGARRVFLSYSWDSEEHVAWVSALAKRLESDGISVVWDRTLTPGADLATFMEQLSGLDLVLIVCTPPYKQKADKRLGGVGYETRLMVAKLIRDQRSFALVPLLRNGSWDQAGPTWTGSSLYLDFRDAWRESEYQRLLGFLRGDTIPPAPVLKPPPMRIFWGHSRSLIVGFSLTLLVPMLADRNVGIISTPAEQAALERYVWMIGLRAGLGCLLLLASIGTGLLAYRMGLAFETTLSRCQIAFGLGALVLCTCFSSLLNLSFLGFNCRVDAAALVWPERLSYGYLVAGLCIVAQSIPGMFMTPRRMPNAS